MSTEQVQGEAGFASQYPYLDRLQEKMEERLAHRVPTRGRFCGFCYGRLRDSDTVCGFCGANLAEAGTVEEIPQPVLRLYKRKQKTEASWVYGLGFVGLIIASALFIVMAIWGPNVPARIGIAFAILIGGGYVLAQIFGTFLGGQIGYRRGAARRDRDWERYLKARESGDEGSL